MSTFYPLILIKIQKVFLRILIYLFANITISLSAQVDSAFQFKRLVVPSALMTSGILLNHNSVKRGIQEDIRNAFPNFDNKLDDYLMMAPTALDLVFTFTDKKANNAKHLSDILIAEVVMYATTKSLKKIIGSQRPNGGGQSFPSGHTSQAFTGATLFFHHYKSENIWLAGSAYVLATATGTMRVLNNRHWISDVFFGAGLGTLIGTLTYYLNPIGSEKINQPVTFDIGSNEFSLIWTF